MNTTGFTTKIALSALCMTGLFGAQTTLGSSPDNVVCPGFRIWVSSENNANSNENSGFMSVFCGDPPHANLAIIDSTQKKSPRRKPERPIAQARACPTATATTVARRKGIRVASSALSTRPPSIGNAGSKLKTPSSRLEAKV